ncbi:hypothetical protein Q1695_002446 [Nippostrongylus brasiliensis]|nr:hypothetical protein Q1695_002446 [Nippostrongylus brasiliensis]
MRELKKNCSRLCLSFSDFFNETVQHAPLVLFGISFRNMNLQQLIMTFANSAVLHNRAHMDPAVMLLTIVEVIITFIIIPFISFAKLTVRYAEIMGSARKQNRARGKEKDSKAAPQVHPTPVVCKVTGCPVPDPIRCFIGTPLSPGEDGVRMECSNEKCPFADVLLHERCFQAFEEHLIKVLSNLGSARGWTEAQRRANLWDKKGQSLIAKVCRCHCGLGMTRMDEIAAYERLKRKAREQEEAQREAALAAGLPTPTKKKHKSKSVLPKLNFGVTKVAPKATHVEEREPRALSRRQKPVTRDVSSSSVSSSPTSYAAFESRRTSFTYASDVWGFLPPFSDEAADNCHLVMSDNFTEQDDTVSTSSKYDFSQGCMDIVPAPAPPRQTMSYASAMKHKRPSQDDSEAQRRSTSLPLSIQIDGHDSGVELKSGSTTDSECSELFSNKDTMSPVKDRTVRMPSVPSLPLASAEVELLSSRSVDCESSSSSTEGLEKSCE